MSNSSNHPELQNAEKAVTAAEAAVAKAQSVVADLESKRAAAVQHGTALADERANVALAAHTGDEKAAKRLHEIHRAIAIHGSELASLDAAIRAAGTKVETAQAALAVELQKIDAIKLKILSRAFVVHMQKLDLILNDLVNGLDNVERIREQLDTLGVGPSHEQFIVLSERPICMALNETAFDGRIGRRLAPHERMTFTELAQAWTRSHEVEVARILGEQTNKQGGGCSMTRASFSYADYEMAPRPQSIYHKIFAASREYVVRKANVADHVVEASGATTINKREVTKMSDRLIDVCKSMNDGGCTPPTEFELTEQIQKYASEHRRDGETAAGAFSRIVTADDDIGLTFRKSLAVCKRATGFPV